MGIYLFDFYSLKQKNKGMNKTFKKAMTLLATVSFFGCGSAPIKAVHVSDQKNTWIEEADSGLFYCTSDLNPAKEIDPVCFPARRSTSSDVTNEIREHKAHATERTEVPEVKEASGTKEAKEAKEVKETSGTKEVSGIKEASGTKEIR